MHRRLDDRTLGDCRPLGYVRVKLGPGS